MANFYKMDPVLWDHGTADLTLEQEAAYLRICNAIYRSEQGCPMNDRVLAGMFRSSTRKARALVDDLIQKGKVFARDGYLWNEKADRELNSIRNKGANPTRNAGEMLMNGERNGREPGMKAPRNDSQRADKPLKSAELFESDQPPKTKTKIEKKTETRQDKDAFEEAFDRLWIEYPRRLTESGSLVKGSRQEALVFFKGMPAEKRQAAVDGLPGFKRVYPDSSKAVCDCVRYLKNERWRDVEGLSVKPKDGVVLPKNGLAPKVSRLVGVVGLPDYRAYFEDAGRCLIEPRGEDAAMVKAVNAFAAEQIRKKFFNQLNSVFGFGKWEVNFPQAAMARVDARFNKE